MKQLKEGPMTLRELSVWFGLKPDTISKSSKSAKEKKLQKLKLFCDYHLENKKIIIDRVHIPEYTKAFKIFEQYFQEEWGHIVNPRTHELSWQYKAHVDTCARVAKAIQYKHSEARQVKEATAIAYVNKIKIDWYGHSYKDEQGEKGYCQIVCLNEDESGILDATQMKILSDCRAEAYQEVNEQRYKIDEARAMGEISEEDWKKAISEVDTRDAYARFQTLLYDRLGFIPIRRLQLIDMYFFDSKN